MSTAGRIAAEQQHERDTRTRRPEQDAAGPIALPGDPAALLRHLQRTAGNSAVNALLRQYAAQRGAVVTAPRHASGASDRERAADTEATGEGGLVQAAPEVGPEGGRTPPPASPSNGPSAPDSTQSGQHVARSMIRRTPAAALPLLPQSNPPVKQATAIVSHAAVEINRYHPGNEMPRVAQAAPDTAVPSDHIAVHGPSVHRMPDHKSPGGQPPPATANVQRRVDDGATVPAPAGPSPASAPTAPAPGPAMIQRIWPFTSTKSDADLIQEAIGKNDPGPISDIKDVSQASPEQRIKLIDVLLKHGGGNADQQTKLIALWDSFGKALKETAAANMNLWTLSWTTCPGRMSESREVQTLREAFWQDTIELAQKYLSDNKQYVHQELQALGLSESEDVAPVPATTAQNEEILKRQAAAKDLADVREARRKLCEVHVGYNVLFTSEGGSPLPEGGTEGVTQKLVPMTYDPDHEPPVGPNEGDNFQPWKKVDDSYRALTQVITAYQNLYPSLFVVGREDDGAQVGAFAQATPEQARATAGKHLREVLHNIDHSWPLIPTLKKDLVPIHYQLLSGQATSPNPKGQGSWSDPVLQPIAKDAVNPQPAPWYEELGFAAAEFALFVIADLATGGFAGVAMAVGNSVLSIGQYEALATMAKTNVTTETALVNGDQVDAAAVSALLATALAILAVAGVVGKYIKGGMAEALQIDRARLAANAAVEDRKGLTYAGRALQKHGNRKVTAFPKARGNPAAINQQAQQIVDGILFDPATKITTRHHAKFGDIIDFRSPDGRGVRFNQDGHWIGFLEP